MSTTRLTKKYWDWLYLFTRSLPSSCFLHELFLMLSCFDPKGKSLPPRTNPNPDQLSPPSEQRRHQQNGDEDRYGSDDYRLHVGNPISGRQFLPILFHISTPDRSHDRERYEWWHTTGHSWSDLWRNGVTTQRCLSRIALYSCTRSIVNGRERLGQKRGYQYVR